MIAALALQGPLARAVLESADRCRWMGSPTTDDARSRSDTTTLDVSRTGFTGDLGSTALARARRCRSGLGRDRRGRGGLALRPVGLLALDVARVEAGLIMAEVDYTSVRHALTREQSSSPFELGLGRLVALEKETTFAGRGGPCGTSWPAAGLRGSWSGSTSTGATSRRCAERHGRSAVLSPLAWRDAGPGLRPWIGRSGGRRAGPGARFVERNLALATVSTFASEPGTHLEMEWSVEGERGRLHRRQSMTTLPFFDPPRKRE